MPRLIGSGTAGLIPNCVIGHVELICQESYGPVGVLHVRSGSSCDLGRGALGGCADCRTKLWHLPQGVYKLLLPPSRPLRLAPPHSFLLSTLRQRFVEACKRFISEPLNPFLLRGHHVPFTTGLLLLPWRTTTPCCIDSAFLGSSARVHLRLRSVVVW